MLKCEIDYFTIPVTGSTFRFGWFEPIFMGFPSGVSTVNINSQSLISQSMILPITFKDKMQSHVKCNVFPINCSTIYCLKGVILKSHYCK